MNISDYEWFKQVPAKNLTSKSLVLVTKFAHRVRRLNGRVLSMRDPFLIQYIFEETMTTGDAELRIIFDLLLLDIKNAAVKAGLDIPKHLLIKEDKLKSSNMTYRGVSIK